jgi:Mlc titration factor MtfA (ptsG expression regulator)
MLITFIILSIAAFLFFTKVPARAKDVWVNPGEFPTAWRTMLHRKVIFYTTLTNEEQAHFEFRINEFLSNCRITGIDTAIDDTDRVLVAASAIIPIFRFPEWRYTNLYEVLIYPTSFNEKFETAGEGRNILGMVGTGYLNGKMILSKQALHHGFDNDSDKRNTAIHEFVHLIDKMDSSIDGLPQSLLNHQYAIPWIELVNKNIEKIYANKSDINPYSATSRIEFFAVVSEYFFERPQLLEQKHPELYELLQKIFNHDLAERRLGKKKHEIGRNDPCPCNSGNKFKKCCGQLHYA